MVSAGTDPLCAFCGRPVIGVAVYGNAGPYHPACTQPPVARKAPVYDDFTPEEWAEIQTRRAKLPRLPPDVGGFLACQRLTAADLNIIVR